MQEANQSKLKLETLSVDRDELLFNDFRCLSERVFNNRVTDWDSFDINFEPLVSLEQTQHKSL